MAQNRSKPRKGKISEASHIPRRRYCIFCDNPKLVIDYKNLDILNDNISERGKILSRRISGTCAKHQRRIAREIKRARFLALMPYKTDIYR